MIYITCPTCGKLLGNIEEIVEDTSINGSNETTKNTGKQKQEHLQKIFEKYGYTRYCCRMRIMSYIDEVNIIK